jgi:hypothetical protein
LSAAIWDDWYIFSTSISGSLTTFCGMLHIPTRSYVELTNITASCMVASPKGTYSGAGSYLWMSEYLAPRVSEVSAIFNAGGLGGLFDQDADATPVVGVLETPYYQPSKGPSRWKNVYLTTRCAAATSISVQRVSSPDASSGTYSTIGTISANGYTRRRIPGGKARDGLGLKLTFGSSAASAIVYSVEADAWQQEGSKVF